MVRPGTETGNTNGVTRMKWVFRVSSVLFIAIHKRMIERHVSIMEEFIIFGTTLVTSGIHMIA
jgi:hypothetical protein